MFNITSGLRRLRKAGQAGGGYDSSPQSFSFNGTNGYIQQVGYSGGVVSKQNDGSRDYWQCYGGYFNIGDSAVHGLDNRSVQTIKFVGTIDYLLAQKNLFAYNGMLSLVAKVDGKVELELGGTSSLRLTSVTALNPGTIYNIIVRVNNTLPSGTARLITDADIFINGVKEAVTNSSFGASTSTNSTLYRGTYNATTNLFRGRLYNFSLWNRALSDTECQAEGLSNRNIVTPTGLVNTWDTSNTSQAISRTGYNMTGSGNYSVATDADGKHILFNGNRDGTSGTGTQSNFISGTFITLNQTVSFSLGVRFKLGVLSTVNQGLFGSNVIISIYTENFAGSPNLVFRIRNGGTFTDVKQALFLNTLYDAYMVYQPSTNRMFCYLATNGGESILLNGGGTLVSASTFGGTQPIVVGDGAIGGGFILSSPTKIYKANVRYRALTQSDINADIALGNNINNDPTIVASYRPDNLINWQGITSQDNMNIAPWSKSSSTVTPGQTDHEGGTTGNRIVWAATPANVQQNVTSLTGASLASKQFTVKMMVKSNTGSAQTARLRCQHITVGDFLSGNLTIPTTWTEITFTATFTSATTGTGIAVGIVSDTSNNAVDIIVSKPRIFLVNEILYDSSPNIGGYVGPQTNHYYSAWVKPGIDAANSASAQPIMRGSYGYTYIRAITNDIRVRYNNRISSAETASSLGTGFRNWIHLIGGIERDGTQFRTAIWINGVKYQTNQFLDASISIEQVQMIVGTLAGTFYQGNLRDLRFFTSPTALTDAQALMITNGGDPMDVTKVLHRDVLPSDTTNYVTDKSGNGRVGYITGGVTKTF